MYRPCPPSAPTQPYPSNSSKPGATPVCESERAACAMWTVPAMEREEAKASWSPESPGRGMPAGFALTPTVKQAVCVLPNVLSKGRTMDTGYGFTIKVHVSEVRFKLVRLFGVDRCTL